MKQQLSLSSTVWLTTLSLPMHIQQWRKSIWWNELKHSVSATSMWTASRNVLLEITKIPIPSLHGKKLTLITIPYCAIKYLLKENTCQYKNAIFIVKKKCGILDMQPIPVFAHVFRLRRKGKLRLINSRSFLLHCQQEFQILYSKK